MKKLVVLCLVWGALLAQGAPLSPCVGGVSLAAFMAQGYCDQNGATVRLNISDEFTHFADEDIPGQFDALLNGTTITLAGDVGYSMTFAADSPLLYGIQIPYFAHSPAASSPGYIHQAVSGIATLFEGNPNLHSFYQLHASFSAYPRTTEIFVDPIFGQPFSFAPDYSQVTGWGGTDLDAQFDTSGYLRLHSLTYTATTLGQLEAQAVPEPSTLWLMAAGVLLLPLRRRCR